jgi:hypothetical protein
VWPRRSTAATILAVSGGSGSSGRPEPGPGRVPVPHSPMEELRTGVAVVACGPAPRRTTQPLQSRELRWAPPGAAEYEPEFDWSLRTPWHCTGKTRRKAAEVAGGRRGGRHAAR